MAAQQSVPLTTSYLRSTADRLNSSRPRTLPDAYRQTSTHLNSAEQMRRTRARSPSRVSLADQTPHYRNEAAAANLATFKEQRADWNRSLRGSGSSRWLREDPGVNLVNEAEDLWRQIHEEKRLHRHEVRAWEARMARSAAGQNAMEKQFVNKVAHLRGDEWLQNQQAERAGAERASMAPLDPVAPLVPPAPREPLPVFDALHLHAMAAGRAEFAAVERAEQLDFEMEEARCRAEAAQHEFAHLAALRDQRMPPPLPLPAAARVHEVQGPRSVLQNIKEMEAIRGAVLSPAERVKMQVVEGHGA